MRLRPRHAREGEGAPHRSRRRTVLVVLGVVLGLVGLTGAALAVVVADLESNVRRDQAFDGLEERARPSPEAVTPEQEDSPPLDLLVLGSDSREDEIGAGLEGAELEDSQHADTTLLVRLTADRDAAWVVSFPRDTWMALPPCRSLDGEQLPEREGQLSTAYSEGGLPCAVAAVEALTDVRIDHTVVVEFSGFIDTVNALDGVPVCLDEPFRPDRVDLELEPGRHVLRDFAALEYVRARYGVDDGSDLSRIERQKEFMASMADRALSRGILLRPDRLYRFLSAATSSLRVDEDLDLRDVALSLRGIDGDRIVFSTLPLDPDPGPEFRPGGRLAGRVAVDEQAAADMFAALKGDRLPLAQAAPPLDDAPPAPGEAPAPAPESPSGATTVTESACR
jgi:LCP family protein required for cell wall assembly